MKKEAPFWGKLENDSKPERSIFMSVSPREMISKITDRMLPKAKTWYNNRTIESNFPRKAKGFIVDWATL